MENLRPSAYDRLLIMLVTVAPMLLLGLGQWRSSLIKPYLLTDDGQAGYLGEEFERAASAWMLAKASDGDRLVLVIDPDCPCAAAARKAVVSALAATGRSSDVLTVVEIGDKGRNGDRLLSELEHAVPSTPTLLAGRDGRLLYAGPVAKGDFCTQAISSVFGVRVLDSGQTSPMINWQANGCFCRNRPQNADRRRISY